MVFDPLREKVFDGDIHLHRVRVLLHRVYHVLFASISVVRAPMTNLKGII